MSQNRCTSVTDMCVRCCDAMPMLVERTPREIDALIAWLAARNLGIVTRKQLMAAGISAHAIAWRVRRGSLVEVHRGVFSVAGATTSREFERHAAIAGFGSGSRLTGLSMFAAHEVTRFVDDEVHVSTPRRAARVLPGAVSSSRVSGAGAGLMAGCTPTESFATSVLDLNGRLTPLQLTNALHDIAFRTPDVVDEVEQRISSGSRVRGGAIVRRAVVLVRRSSRGTKSRTEDRFHGDAIRRGIPEPIVNTPRVFAGAALEPDFVWPRWRVVVETDGGQHGRDYNVLSDELRDAAYEAEGYTLFRIPSRVVWRGAHRVLDQIFELTRR